MNQDLALGIVETSTWVGAVAFGIAAIIYIVLGRWRETWVGVFYAVTLVIISGALFIRAFAFAIPEDVRPFVGVIVYAIFALTGLGTLPTIAHAVLTERKRRKHHG